MKQFPDWGLGSAANRLSTGEKGLYIGAWQVGAGANRLGAEE